MQQLSLSGKYREAIHIGKWIRKTVDMLRSSSYFAKSLLPEIHQRTTKEAHRQGWTRHFIANDLAVDLQNFVNTDSFVYAKLHMGKITAFIQMHANKTNAVADTN